MKKIFNSIKTDLINRLVKRNIISIYNLEIDYPNKNITKTDLSLAHFFLKFTPSKDSLFCNIRTWSDNVFVYISCKGNRQNWESCTEDLLTVSEILNDGNEDYKSDFLYLVVDEELYDKNNELADVLNHTVDFINDTKKEYQSICSIDSIIYFQQGCTINSYKIVWGQEDRINYIFYDMG